MTRGKSPCIMPYILNKRKRRVLSLDFSRELRLVEEAKKELRKMVFLLELLKFLGGYGCSRYRARV